MESQLKQELKKKQIEMAQKVIIPSAPFLIHPTDIIATFDIQYKDDFGFVAIDLIQFNGENQQLFLHKAEVKVPYEPGYFAFREGPLLFEAYEKLLSDETIKPSLLIIDGHGTAHPRQFGVACWMGVKTNTSVIGVAKEPLIPFEGDLAFTNGSIIPYLFDNKEIGYVYRSQNGIKPIFVSAGHLISQREALRIVETLRGEYRILSTIRRADQAARKFAKGEIEEGYSDLKIV